MLIMPWLVELSFAHNVALVSFLTNYINTGLSMLSVVTFSNVLGSDIKHLKKGSKPNTFLFLRHIFRFMVVVVVRLFGSLFVCLCVFCLFILSLLLLCFVCLLFVFVLFCSYVYVLLDVCV